MSEEQRIQNRKKQQLIKALIKVACHFMHHPRPEELRNNHAMKQIYQAFQMP